MTTVKVIGEWQNLTLSRRSTLEPIVTKFETRGLGRGHTPPKKFGGQFAQGFLPPTCAKSLKTFECLLHFLSFHPSPHRRARWVDFCVAFNTSYNVVLRKEVPFGVRKIDFKI